GLGRLGVGLGGLLVRLAAVVRLVEPAALEHDGRAGGDQTLKPRLGARRALLERRRRDRLELLELVTAALAAVLVRRHSRTLRGLGGHTDLRRADHAVAQL